MSDSSKEATLCLSMIVRDEAHVIRRCLESIRPHLTHWVVVDTGSTDDTPQIVQESLSILPGRLYYRPWRDFSHNRNEALQLAREFLSASDQPDGHILVIDADETLESVSSIAMPSLNDDIYYVRHRVVNHTTSFFLGSIVRAPIQARYEGVLHEVMRWPSDIRTSVLEGLEIKCFFDSARNANPQAKYEEDARILERALLDRPNEPRLTFYLAQSYRDSYQYEKSIATYRQRLELDGFEEEAWYSLYQLGMLYERLGHEGDAFLAYIRAFARRPTRSEPLLSLAAMLRSKQWWAPARSLAAAALSIPKPDDLLFLDESAYSWRALDEYAMACHFGEYYQESLEAYRRVLNNPDLPTRERARVESNLERLEVARATPRQRPHSTDDPMTAGSLSYKPSLLENQARLERRTYKSGYEALAMLARAITELAEVEPTEKMSQLQLLPDDHPGVLDARAVCGFYCKGVRPDLYQVGVESLRKLLDDHRYRGYVHQHQPRLAANAEFYGTPWISLADEPETFYALIDEINAELERPDRSHEERRRLEERRATMAPRDTCRYRHVHYPEEIVTRLAVRGPASDHPRLALTITTCRRLSLFKESMNSFLNCCLDLDMIDLWILIDDNSSEEDRAEMRRLYPFFHFIEKGPDDRGHARGLNILWKLLLEREVEHCLHLEDDRVFLRPTHYVRTAMDILEHGAERGVAQVVYSRHYADSWNDWHRHEGIRVIRQDPFLRYVIQDNMGISGPTRPGTLPRLVWPHFSLNPSMIHIGRLEREQRLALVFSETDQWFEREFARRYEAAGYLTAYPDDIFVLHTGKLFWEQHKLGKDAYELNGHERYGRKYQGK